MSTYNVRSHSAIPDWDSVQYDRNLFVGWVEILERCANNLSHPTKPNKHEALLTTNCSFPIG
jgi:hypothetical protein